MNGHVRCDDGVRLAFDRFGPPDRPAAILLHGGGQTRHSWSGTARRLAGEGYQVLNFDARGHGDSDWSGNGDYSLDRRASDLRSILAGVKAPFALIGASLGGATAAHAVAGGLRPAALVLVDVVPNAEQVGLDRIRNFMLSAPDGFASLQEAADAVAAYNPERPRPDDTSGLRKNLRTGADGRLRWHWDPRIIADDGGAMRRSFAASALALADIPDVPALLVRGLRSDVVSSRAAKAFQASFPSLEILDVEGAGHMIAGDRNDAFSAGVIAYLRRHMPVGIAAPDTPLPNDNHSL